MEKKFKLSDLEVKQAKFRRMVVDYLINAANNEMGQYIYLEVRPRLDLPQDAAVELSEDGQWLIVKEEPKIISGIKPKKVVKKK
jgi:hypothetical protein